MPEIIASTYEINQEIGAGGSGIVYLGRHIRLNKTVVLKADKRTLSAKPEALRREVDALKDLSHTYIPQVYDFVEQDGNVYTIMDFIDGESLDKPLKRGEKIAQPQLIEWACELLEALSYLHSRPPYGILHGDIKPANIMVTKENDIRLIDFNIALALGEEGAVRVGFSRGYASPEHYGLDYSVSGTTTEDTTGSRVQRKTEVETATASMAGDAEGSTLPEQTMAQPKKKTTILLDVRSDIYSVGATLYHLLTGRRPDWDAKKVVPIQKNEASPAVAAIIMKAMQPDPADRYQTADAMLAAFRGLHNNDPRTKRHRRREIGTAILLAAVFAAGGGSTFIGLQRMQRQENAYALAEYSANTLRAGDVTGAIQYALQALPETRGLLDPPYTPQAQKALTDALGVYDLADGFQAHLAITLPSEPLKMEISPDGKRLAVFYAYEAAVYDLETGAQLAALPGEPSALSDVHFAGNDILVYAGADGIRAYSLAEGRELWAGQAATQITLSGDASRVAAINRDATQAIVYNMADGSIAQTVDFNDRHQSVLSNDTLVDTNQDVFALNQNGTMLASSFSDGSFEIFNLTNLDASLELDPMGFDYFGGGFFEKYFVLALSSSQNSDSLLVFLDVNEGMSVAEMESTFPFLVKTNETGIYIGTKGERVVTRIDPETGEQTEIAYMENGTVLDFSVNGTYSMVSSTEKNYALFHEGAVLTTEGTIEDSCDFVAAAGEFAVIGSLNTPVLRVLRLADHQDAQLFSYDPTYLHDEARLSADGSTIMLFSVRGFRLFQTGGPLIAEVQFPAPQLIFDQQYRRDEQGSRLEVYDEDGTVRSYSAVDGSLLSQSLGEPYGNDVTEEFYTDRYHIVAPLHEAPQVYDRKNGALVCELESDAYLTYVTQLNNGILTQYISSEGEAYGVLLDENCQVLARMPFLCDVIDDRVLFDFPTGNIRQSRLYSLEELMTMARQQNHDPS